jgi:hypothetical protein
MQRFSWSQVNFVSVREKRQLGIVFLASDQKRLVRLAWDGTDPLRVTPRSCSGRFRFW